MRIGFTAYLDDSHRDNWLSALNDHGLLKLSPSANVMTELAMRDPSRSAVIKLAVHYRKIFESSYDVTFDEARLSNISKEWESCEFLRGAVDTAYLRCSRVTRLLRRY